jgi:hypothetical protein
VPDSLIRSLPRFDLRLCRFSDGYAASIGVCVGESFSGDLIANPLSFHVASGSGIGWLNSNRIDRPLISNLDD